MNPDIAWTVFLAAAGLVFAGLEAQGLRDNRDGKKHYGTLSATLRRWLGIDPRKPRRWPLRIGFLGLLTWFSIHILTPYL